MKSTCLVCGALAWAIGCGDSAKPNYRWYKFGWWTLDSTHVGGSKGQITFEQRSDNTLGLNAAGVPSGTELDIGALRATFESGNSFVALDIRSALGATPLAVFDEQAATDDSHPILSAIPVTVRYPSSDVVFTTSLVADIAKPLANSLLDKVATGPVAFADEIASDPPDTMLVVLDTNFDGHAERRVTVKGPGKTFAQVDWIALVDHVDAGNRRCHGYSDGHGGNPTSLVMMFHATRVRLFDRRRGTQVATITAKGKQTCPTEVTLTGSNFEGLPIVWSGGSDIYNGGDEAFAWMDKQLAALAR